jgi:uncharacterized DUF497 family protein
MYYTVLMKPFEWSKTKNDWLKKERGISFEEIVNALNEGKMVDTYDHSNQERYPNQKVFVLQIDDYVYLVPFVEDNEKIFLKTIFRSRKATRKYLKSKIGGKDGQKNR